MAWDSEADELFPHTVTLEGPGEFNYYGRRKDAAGGPTSVSALVQHKMRLVRDKDGSETASSITVYLNGTGGVQSITPEWVLTLPDGTTRPILSVDRHADEDGDVFEVVHLQ